MHWDLPCRLGADWGGVAPVKSYSWAPLKSIKAASHQTDWVASVVQFDLEWFFNEQQGSAIAELPSPKALCSEQLRGVMQDRDRYEDDDRRLEQVWTQDSIRPGGTEG